MPPVVFLGIVYYEDLRAARNSLREVTEQGAQRIDILMKSGEELLVEVSQTIDVDDPAAEEALEKLVYDNLLFREIGIIDEQGFLVLTSLGELDPPVWVKPEHRSSSQNPELQILGLARTAVMAEESIILSLPTQGSGEVNALIDPAILTSSWEYVFSSGLGSDGFFAYIHTETNQVLASQGVVPPVETLERDTPAHRIRVTQVSQNGDILVVGEVSRRWILSQWRRMLLIGGPVTALSSGLLVFLLMRMVKQSGGLDRELIIGLKNREFAIHYQPIINLETSACVGSEALLRWYHPEEGVLSPGVFIPVAEKTGFINQIGEWLIKEIAQEQAHLYEQFPKLYTSVNLSPSQIHSGSLEKLLTWLQDTNLCAPKRFLFEVTETASVISPGTATTDILARIRATGARIAIDDFGQGYSGLSYLHELDVDVLKIDQLYVSAINKNSQLTSILESIIELGTKLGFTLVAEGIETEEQRQFLCDHGVEYGQGWLFSRPLPIREFEQFIQQMPPSERADSHS